jgi:hypothetical protein
MKFYILEFNSAHKGDSGEEIKNNYDLTNACKNCGTGAQLNGPLFTNGLKNVTSDIFYTLAWDIIISEKLYQKLNNNGVEIGKLKKVVDKKNIFLNFYHLDSQFSFPKSLSISTGFTLEGQCPICKKNGYFNEVKIGNPDLGVPTIITPIKLYYGKIEKDFLLKSDIFKTWEHTGLSNLKKEGNKVVRYARPMYIISEKLVQLLLSLKIKGLEFNQIFIED